MGQSGGESGRILPDSQSPGSRRVESTGGKDGSAAFDLECAEIDEGNDSGLSEEDVTYFLFGFVVGFAAALIIAAFFLDELDA